MRSLTLNGFIHTFTLYRNNRKIHVYTICICNAYAHMHEINKTFTIYTCTFYSKRNDFSVQVKCWWSCIFFFTAKHNFNHVVIL